MHIHIQHLYINKSHLLKDMYLNIWLRICRYKHIFIHQDWTKKAKEMSEKYCSWENSGFGFLLSVPWLSI